MKKGLWIWGGCMFWFLFMAASLCRADDLWQDIGKEMLNVKVVLIDPVNSKVIYAGTDKGIFKSEDAGSSWRNIFLTKGSNRGVNLLLFDPKDNNAIYAVTGSGLFYSPNDGSRWDRIFKGKNYFEADCLTAAILPNGIYLGTKQGLFISRDKGRSWDKELGRLGSAQIFNIAYSYKEPGCLYLASTDGVFKSKDSGKSWERVFIAHPSENGQEIDSGYEDQDEEAGYSEIRYLVIDPNNPKYLYLATNRGIYESKDSGMSWKMFPAYGLLSRDVNFLLFSGQAQFYCVSKSGIFTYQDSAWRELSFTLGVSKINFIALDKNAYLYACADKGLFKLNLGHTYTPRGSDILTEYSKDEPGIQEVQKAAIKYAEVDPDKIMRWRKQAAKRALLPHLTVGMDRDNNRTVSSSIWGIYGSNGSPGKYFVGPDDETKYNNKNWGVSLTWELGDLIFSDDQTNIDVRSRLMVELRNDVLDEVNKIYFERIRVKMELDNLSIEDRKKRFEKELRVRELTASIDALTGGYFSRSVKLNGGVR